MPPLSRQWRSLEELARSPSFVARAAQEFPSLAAALAAPRDRRRVLKLMAAALALAGLGGCGDGAPSGELIPPVRPPRDAIAYGSNMFATASVLGGYASGVLVRHAAGRPVKVEGNPAHPASLGATDAIAQAEILGFYDLDRAAGIARGGVPQSWQNLQTALAAQRARWRETHGEGLRILTGTVTSPSLARQLADLQQLYPAMRWHQWEPLPRDAVREAAMRAYGRPLALAPQLDKADVIVAIDSDLLCSAPGHVRFARDFAARRNPVRAPQMSRVYAIEPTPTLIGAAADHRLAAGPREMHRIVAALAEAVLHGTTPPAGAPDWLRAASADLLAAHGRGFIHVGPHQPAELHVLVHAMNETLGGRGATYDLIEPVEASPVAQAQSLTGLVDDMHAGRVESLVIIDGNPVFAAPGTLGFGDALQHVAFSLALTVEPNETSKRVQWSLPQTHPYEDWSDARAYDGTATILQPQAQPLYGGISPHRLLGLLAGHDAPGARDVVRATWRARFTDPDRDWHDALAAGVVPQSASAISDAKLRADAASTALRAPTAEAMTLLFRHDPHVWDGRFANNAWLQELPRPFTKLTWDNPLLISPGQARRLGVRNGDRVVLSLGEASLALPTWIVPGQADDVTVATTGFGRRVVGTVGEHVGWDVFPLMGRDGAPVLRKGDGSETLACTEHHDAMEARGDDFARHGTLEAFTADQHFLADQAASATLYRRRPPGPAEWGMSVDLNACIGCNACVIACMAENNVPVVGKEQVIREREMHWLRIDRYYHGDPDAPGMLFQPVLCMHCEQAPCETVCPVGATVHDDEGLNVMVYNRCVGTRFCSNNCPYKVRRFNYFAFAAEEKRPAIARNPEVTVRARGVMEKCTFCLQRIAAARVEADVANRPVGGNEVRTACQAACPTQAISFGNMAAQDAEVLTRKASPLSYALLAEQNTHPRVTYEARIANPSPAIRGAKT
jgi:MoCo/4Fe-4S cofactor protein with predicted Tat translocation signal